MPSESSPPRDELTLAELCSRVGMSVRTVRFYTGRGLVPPPVRRGRSGYYSADHVARLELVRELQAHGFTLAAIERYLARIPAGASPDTIALHGTLIAPWKPDRPESLSRSELAKRAGRDLSPADLDTLQALGIIEPAGRERYEVSVGQLSVGVAILDLGLPSSAAMAAQQIFATHGRAVAEELTALFLGQVWPAYKEAGAPADHIRSVVERFKPVTINALVAAYETAVDETKRKAAARRTDGTAEPR